jgi:hypothetical protein
MAYFGAGSRPPARVCRERVLSADIFVLIAGFRYGTTLPNQTHISYTEFEFNVAREANIPRLVFMLDEQGTIGPKALFIDEIHGDRQIAFRQRLQVSDVVVQRVSSPPELETGVLQSLRDLYESAAKDIVRPRAEPRSGQSPSLLQSALDKLHDSTFSYGLAESMRSMLCLPVMLQV